MDIKTIAKEVRKQLKAEFPEHKYSVTIDRFSGGQSLDVHLMAGPDNPFDGDVMHQSRYDGDTCSPQGGNAQLNHHYITQNNFTDKWVSNGIILTEPAAKMLIRVVEIANKRNWNRSDCQVDYFDVNFWFHIGIGKWNKDYQITGVS